MNLEAHISWQAQRFVNLEWIVAGNRLKKAHSTQLRHATEREKLIAEATEAPTLPWTVAALGRSLDGGQ